MDWQTRLLDALIALDQEESPHGLYGLREAHSTDPRQLRSWEYILWSPAATDFVRRHGFGPPPGHRLGRSLLSIEGTGAVSIKILNLASTKVRCFGSAYRLDKATPQREFDPDWDISRELTHLWKSKSRYGFSPRKTRSVLLISHAAKIQNVHEFLGDVRSVSFLQRYHLELHERDWSDHYDRGFESGIFLWTEINKPPASDQGV